MVEDTDEVTGASYVASSLTTQENSGFQENSNFSILGSFHQTRLVVLY